MIHIKHSFNIVKDCGVQWAFLPFIPENPCKWRIKLMTRQSANSIGFNTILYIFDFVSQCCLFSYLYGVLNLMAVHVTPTDNMRMSFVNKKTVANDSVCLL